MTFFDAVYRWRNSTSVRCESLYFPETGQAAIWANRWRFKAAEYRVFTRNDDGRWTCWGIQEVGWHNRTTYRKSVKHERSSEWLDAELCRQCEVFAHHENLARDLANGVLLPDVLAFVQIPASHKTKAKTVEARTAQKAWAKAVIALAGWRCTVTGTCHALEAAHIKPFVDCSVSEAYSLQNGVCLTASAHRLFDSGQEVASDDPLARIVNTKMLEELHMRREQSF